MTVRSLLFVPGSRPDRFAKALAAGADAVCIDLEDSVPPAGKDAARGDVLAFLAGQSGAGLRINALRTADGVRDLAALADVALPAFVMVPKTEHTAELAVIAAILPGAALWPVVESAAGLAHANAIAAAPGVAGLLFGAVDLAAESGCTLEWEALLFARGALASARAAAHVELLDVPLLDVHDDHELASSSLRARALGFTGRACIHPAQVATVNRAFSPSEAQLTHARRIVEASVRAAGGAALLDGRLVEKPVVLAAQRLLAGA